MKREDKYFSIGFFNFFKKNWFLIEDITFNDCEEIYEQLEGEVAEYLSDFILGI